MATLTISSKLTIPLSCVLGKGTLRQFPQFGYGLKVKMHCASRADNFEAGMNTR